jgi:hypothetical protein
MPAVRAPLEGADRMNGRGMNDEEQNTHPDVYTNLNVGILNVFVLLRIMQL